MGAPRKKNMFNIIFIHKHWESFEVHIALLYIGICEPIWLLCQLFPSYLTILELRTYIEVSLINVARFLLAQRKNSYRTRKISIFVIDLCLNHIPVGLSMVYDSFVRKLDIFIENVLNSYFGFKLNEFRGTI